jgi:small conductance mechanosensitive channel
LVFAFLLTDLTWDSTTDWLATHGLRIVFIVLLAAVIAQIVKHLIPRVVNVAVRRQLLQDPPEDVRRRAETISTALRNTILVFVFVTSAFMVLAEVGINITPLLTGAGIIGVALGFGAQSLVRDVIKGFFILLENQYSRGDLITVAGVSGIVDDVTLRRTVIHDERGVVHYIPNGEITVASNRTNEVPASDQGPAQSH